MDITRNENWFVGLRGRAGRATTESRVTILGTTRGHYPTLGGSFSWLGADVFAGHSPRNLPDEMRIYAGPSLSRTTLGDGVRPDTASARVQVRPDSLVRALLPWHSRTLHSSGAVVGLELRLPIEFVGSRSWWARDRVAVTLAAEYRLSRIDTDKLAMAHAADFRAWGQDVTTRATALTAFPPHSPASSGWAPGAK
jgi:hypothetical protein